MTVEEVTSLLARLGNALDRPGFSLRISFFCDEKGSVYWQGGACLFTFHSLQDFKARAQEIIADREQDARIRRIVQEELAKLEGDHK